MLLLMGRLLCWQVVPVLLRSPPRKGHSHCWALLEMTETKGRQKGPNLPFNQTQTGFPDPLGHMPNQQISKSNDWPRVTEWTMPWWCDLKILLPQIFPSGPLAYIFNGHSAQFYRKMELKDKIILVQKKKKIQTFFKNLHFHQPLRLN